MGKVLSFVNNKGGVGKTTSAAAVGFAMAKMERKILFVDLDSQANLTAIVSDVNMGDHKWEKTLEDAFIFGSDHPLPIQHTENPYVDFIPTDLDLANFDNDMSRVPLKELLLKDLLETVRDDYDYIILDCPPSLSSITYNAMIASDFLVLVTHPEGSSCKGMNMIIELYNTIINNKHFNPNLEIIGCIITKSERDNVSKYYTDYIMKNFGPVVFNSVVPKTTKITQATSFNKNLFEVDPGGKAALAYISIAKDIMLRINDYEMK